MSAQNGKTSDWMIERLALGELDPAAAAEVRRRLIAEGRSPDELVAALERSNRETLAAHPGPVTAAAIRRRAALATEAGPSRARGRLFWLAGPVAAGALAVALLVARPSPPPAGGPAPSETEATRVKGVAVADPRLYVYRHGRQGDQRLVDGARVAPGDLLQLAYQARAEAWGVLLSVDGAGRVTVHWPEDGSVSAPRLRAEREIRLPSAYQLDDAPAFERFFFVSADRPFAVSAVVEAARALAAQPKVARREALPLSAPLQQVSLTLEKIHGQTAGEVPGEVR